MPSSSKSWPIMFLSTTGQVGGASIAKHVTHIVKPAILSSFFCLPAFGGAAVFGAYRIWNFGSDIFGLCHSLICFEDSKKKIRSFQKKELRVLLRILQKHLTDHCLILYPILHCLLFVA